METKRAKVVMLPTKDKTNIIIASDNKIYYHNQNSSIVINGKHQHLYIITDVEIKEGDWVYSIVNRTNKRVYQVKNIAFNNADFYNLEENKSKIIATTDKSLSTIHFESTDNSRKEIRRNYLPQPSQAFIKKYCELGGIDEVLVEYQQRQVFESADDYTYGCGIELKADSHNTITIHSIKDNWDREEYVAGLEEAYMLGVNAAKHGQNVKELFDGWVKGKI